MLVTTTSTLEGKRITKYLGIVSGETILGAHLFRDLRASFTNIVGGRAAGYERSLREAKATALEEMVTEAQALGANAVIAVDIDYESISTGMLMVTAAGTAIIYE